MPALLHDSEIPRPPLYLSKDRLSLSEISCRLLTGEEAELFSTLDLDLEIDDNVPRTLEPTC